MFKHLAVSRRITYFRLIPRASASYSTGESVPPPENTEVPPQGSGKRRGGFFLKLVGATILGVGGTAAACYLNSDVKETLETSVPYFKETEEVILSAISSFGLLEILNGIKENETKKAIQQYLRICEDDFPLPMKPSPILRPDDKTSDTLSISIPPTTSVTIDEATKIEKEGSKLFAADSEEETKKKDKKEKKEKDKKDKDKEKDKDKKDKDKKDKDKDKKDKDKKDKDKKDKDKKDKDKKDKDKKDKDKKDKDKKDKDKKDKDKKKDKEDDEEKERKKLLKKEKKEEKKRRKIEKLLKEKQEEEERQALQVELERKGLLEDISKRSLHLSGTIQSAISAQVNLETKVRQHTSQLKKTLEENESTVEGQDSSWRAVSAAHDARFHASSDAASALSAATQEMNSLKKLLEESRKDQSISSDKTFMAAQEKLIQNEYDLNVARENTRKAETEASSVLIYKELIEKGKRKFLEEVENIKHDHSLSSKDGKMTEDDWNFLVTHSYKRIEQLLKRIVELELGQRVLVDSAVNFQRISDEELTEQRLKTELQRQRSDFELEKQRWNNEARSKFDIELREALARQAAAHSDHLVHVLRVQREEQNRHFELETRERILRERESFQAAIEKWISRVKGLETAVENRAELERQGQLSQKLWLACQDFKDTITNSDDMDKTTPLKEKLNAVSLASQEDPILERIMSEVSPVAENRGIFSMDALRHRFSRVKKVCKRVAMIDETGGTLIQYTLSWLQSLFIFESARIFGPDEDVNEFDTFTLLANAEECIRNGDLETGLKFMAQLRGMPRLVADDWINECRLTLEAQLVADTMIAFSGDRSARAILKEQ